MNIADRAVLYCFLLFIALLALDFKQNKNRDDARAADAWERLAEKFAPYSRDGYVKRADGTKMFYNKKYGWYSNFDPIQLKDIDNR